jgi:3-oxoacyl-[acyl-carrier-protein] synthase-3
MNQIGIAEIGTYVPVDYLLNRDKQVIFDFDDDFLATKIGIQRVSKKRSNEETSDMCVLAFEDLFKKKSINLEAIDCIVVVTQNPDVNGIPHTSSIVHAKIGLKKKCAAFDISLGCSGYVYALSIVRAFMSENGLKNGLLFTADPYSKIIDPDDKNTSLLFGDAATVTLLNEFPLLLPLTFKFNTNGSEGGNLKSENNILYMNGRAVYNFSAVEVPLQVKDLLNSNNLSTEDIDMFFMHQGSKFILDTLEKRLNIAGKVPTNLENQGNTISSSIPLLLEKYIHTKGFDKIVISGFGVGLSWASAILQYVK